MASIFDGKAYAQEKEKKLKLQVRNLSKKGIKPKLDSIIVGDDPASILYQNLKKKAAERIGAEIRVKVYPDSVAKEELTNEIKKLNSFPSVNGIMVQLPLPVNFSTGDRDEIIKSISPEKDIDGLRPDSKFTPPTAKAVMQILKEALRAVPLKARPCKVVVVGASGFIGRQIVRQLKKEYMNTGIKELTIKELDIATKDLRPETKDSDVLISVTGFPDLIKADTIKDGVILIDVGAPKGDIEKSAYEKAIFVSPVPGGVGPVGISCLMENLVEAVENQSAV